MCDQVLPALDAAAAAGAPVRILSQSAAAETAAQARRLGLRASPSSTPELELSARFDPDAVPALLLLDAGEERGRVEGLHRARMAELAAAAGAQLDLDGLPEMRPGCASAHARPGGRGARSPRAAPAPTGRIRSRDASTSATLEDPFEALHERGLTDGLPVVPPTPERVVAMLEHTSRDPQDVVGVVPPYGGRATVEKVASTRSWPGCRRTSCRSCSPRSRRPAREEFALHGLVATTYPPGPAIVVSGPLRARGRDERRRQRARARATART